MRPLNDKYAYYSVLLSQVEVLVVMAGGAPRESMLNGAVNSLRNGFHVTSIRGLSAAFTFSN